MNKIDIVNHQILVCLTCGTMPTADVDGRCYLCHSKNFCKPDFLVRGVFPAFSNGSIHEREKVSDRDYENHKALVNRGILPIFVTAGQLKKALGK